MRKNEEIVVEITDIGINGEGVGHYDGCALFVRDAVVGDTVRCALTKVAKTYAYARLVQVITPSPYRVRPRCPIAARCGGCQLQYYSYEAQLDLKRRKVREDLIRIGHFSPETVDGVMLPIVGMEDPWRYRNKEQVPVGLSGGASAERKSGGRTAGGAEYASPVMGFYAVHSHSIVPMTDCLIGREENAEILKTVLSWMKKYRVPAYDENSGKGLLRHILIRNGRLSGEVMVCLVTNGNSLPHASALIDALKALPGMTSVTLNENTVRTNVILGARTFILWGEPVILDSLRVLDAELTPAEDAGGGKWTFRETGREVRFTISARSFYQVNPVQTEKLYSLVRKLGGFGGAGRVADLYCGVGTISLFIADAVGKVTGVEVIPEAVEDARKNAESNGIRNAEFLAGRAEEVLPGMEGSFDGIVVDPPRKGLDETLIRTILSLSPEKVIYVSCDPATLARDLVKLCAGGYEIRTVVPVDQFPHTVHVETVCCLYHQKKDFISVPYEPKM